MVEEVAVALLVTKNVGHQNLVELLGDPLVAHHGLGHEMGDTPAQVPGLLIHVPHERTHEHTRLFHGHPGQPVGGQTKGRDRAPAHLLCLVQAEVEQRRHQIIGTVFIQLNEPVPPVVGGQYLADLLFRTAKTGHTFSL